MTYNISGSIGSAPSRVNTLLDDAPLIQMGATFSCSDIRLYPNQFLIGPEAVDGLDGWHSVFVGADVVITHHPDLSVTQVHGTLVSLTLLGYILDPENPTEDDESILLELVSGFSTFDQLVRDTGRYGGRWVLLARSAGEIRLFNDALGLRQVFYTRQRCRGGIWAGSQPGMLAECLQLQIDDAALEFIDSYAFRSHTEYRWPAAGSAFREIRHLLPNHWLGMLTGRETRYWPHQRREHVNPDTAVDRFVQLLQGMIQAAARRFDIALGITAGWDSRLVLAASRDISDAIDYVTVRQGKMADSADDILVPSRLLRRLGLQHTVIKALPIMSPDFSYCFKRSVYLAHEHYGGDAEALLSWSGRRKVAMTGAGAEVGRCSVRSHPPGGDRRPITARDLARLQQMGDSAFAVAEFQLWLDDLGDLRGYKLLDLFEWEQGHGNWAAATQLEFDSAWQDIFTPYNCRELLGTLLSVEERYRVPPDYPLGRMAIARLWPEVLAEPVNPAKAATRKRPTRPVGRGLSALRYLFMGTR